MQSSESPLAAVTLIRHGETTYSNSLPDLTKEGREMVEKTALNLRDYVFGFDHLIAVSSPAMRAQETIHILLKILGESKVPIRLLRLIRPFDIKDMSGFLTYDKAHTTPYYGQMWLTDPFLGNRNPLTESRHSVETRVYFFLTRYTRYLAWLVSSTQKRYLLIGATHFEVMTPIMKGLYTEEDDFPIASEKPPQLAEAVTLEINNPSRYEFTMISRGTARDLSYNPRTRCFKHLS